MKIRCPREPFLTALQSCSAVVPARSRRPVLTNVKLEATREGAVLSATDLEIGIRVDVEGVETSRSIRSLAERTGVEMPISAAVHAVLFEGLAPRQALRSLMERETSLERVG